HDYPSAAWRRSYQRRTAAERANATIKDTATSNIARGCCRLMGLAPLTLWIACTLAIRNQRILTTWDPRQAANARPAAARPPPPPTPAPNPPAPAPPRPHPDRPHPRHHTPPQPPPAQPPPQHAAHRDRHAKNHPTQIKPHRSRERDPTVRPQM